jgi:hypothetical protein
MTKFDCNSPVISSDELQKYSRHFVNEFLKKVELYPPVGIDLSFYPSDAVYKAKTQMSHLGPIYSEKQDNCLTVHVCEAALKGIPLLALQGWLEQELTCCLLKLQPELYQFNFSKQILPLVRVSGSAVNLLRHMVEHLKHGLNRFLATRIIIDSGEGLSQVCFCLFKMDPSLEERDNYHRIIPHRWIRASFLCEKLKEFVSISLLADRNIVFAMNLKSVWWKHHEYLTNEDRIFLEDLVIIPDKYSDAPYSMKLIEMFRKLQSYFFAHQHQAVISEVLH